MDRSYRHTKKEKKQEKKYSIFLKATKWGGAKYIVQRCICQTEKL